MKIIKNNKNMFVNVIINSPSLTTTKKIENEEEKHV